jgi:hypothetical protein
MVNFLAFAAPYIAAGILFLAACAFIESRTGKARA